MTSTAAGMNAANIPSMTRAKQAAQKVFALIDDKSTLDVREAGKAKIQDLSKVQGEIQLQNVTFQYPTRDQPVLNGMNLNIPATHKIALVGGSGCGKSTITNLLLRFYEIKQGTLLVDGCDIKDYNIEKLRRSIGYVMQEPILWNQTIKDNVLYGKPGASDVEIRHACELANATSFIESDFEELDKAERVAKAKEQLTEKINDLSKQFLQISNLESLADNESITPLLLEVLTKADTKALNLINHNLE